MRPQATLHIESSERGGEDLSLPSVVARTLAAKQKADELHPASRGELLFLVRETSVRSAYLCIEKLINRRDYSTFELDQKLKQDGFDEELRSHVLGRAVECGLVSDERFGASFVRSKLSAGWGLNRIERALSERGVDAHALRGWPDAFLEDFGTEYDRAIKAARSHQTSAKQNKEKLARFLYQRGFTTDVALRASKQVIEEAQSKE